MNNNITIFKNHDGATVVCNNAVTHIESRGNKYTFVHLVSGKIVTVELSIQAVALRLWNVMPQQFDDE